MIRVGSIREGHVTRHLNGPTLKFGEINRHKINNRRLGIRGITLSRGERGVEDDKVLFKKPRFKLLCPRGGRRMRQGPYTGVRIEVSCDKARRGNWNVEGKKLT